MKFNVFFCWESETDQQGFNNRDLLGTCIKSALESLKSLNENFDYDLFEPTRGIPKEFSKETFDKIASCDIFIADFTITTPPKGDSHSRREPNANVLSEFSFALRNGCGIGCDGNFENQIVLVCNAINGSPEKDNSLIPADYRGRYFPIEFVTDENGKIKEESGFYETFRKSLNEAVDNAKKNFSKKFKPFISWEEHSQDADFSKEYFWTSQIEGFKNNVLENGDILRIVGLSGIGKTRFVFECFRNSELSEYYLYYDCCEDDGANIVVSIRKLFQNYEKGIIVLDNCDSELLDKVINERRKKSARNPILVISNDLLFHCPVDVKEIRFEDGYNEIVQRMLHSYKECFPVDQCDQIVQYSDGIPMMAELLIRGIENGRELGNVGHDLLLTKLLDTEYDGNTIIFLQSLALFNYLGYEKDLRPEFEFVAKTKDITSVNISSDEVLLNTFEEVVETYKEKKIIERKGRMIGLRPAPLAFHLISIWLEKCSASRMLRVIKAIQEAPFCDRLIDAFGERFRYMGFSPKAQEMLRKLLSCDSQSPFANAELMNTKLGSHLFRVFVEVNPYAVSLLLKNVLGVLSQDQLLDFKEGRRNIIVTLEKLCFIEETFYDGASLMLQFANAENETWSNNATGEFIRIFSIYLPATSVNLSIRLAFLNDKIKEYQNKSIIIKALSRALNTDHFMYFSGAEKFGTKTLNNYFPEKEEVVKYIDGALNLICEEIENKSEFSIIAEEVLIESIAPLCRYGAAKKILSCVEKISNEKKYDWDNLLDKLTSITGYINPFLDDNEKQYFEKLKSNLTKEDIISRYVRIPKEVFSTNVNSDVNEIIRIQEKKFEQLATELLEQKRYDKSLLKRIMLVKNVNSYTFGKILADGLNDEERKKFIRDGIEIINENPDADITVLLRFITSINNDLFFQLLPELKKLRDLKLLYAIAGQKDTLVDDELFIFLIDCVKERKNEADFFVMYWNYAPINSWPDSRIASFFRIISTLDNSIAPIIKMSNILVLYADVRKYPLFIATIVEIILSECEKANVLTIDFSYNVIASILINFHDDKFAQKIHIHIIQYLKKCERRRFNVFEISKIYEVLFRQYFEVIWPNLSRALLCEDLVLNYNLERVIGCSFAVPTGSSLTLLPIEKNEELFLKWCRDYPDKAPVRLISLIPLLTQNEKKFYDLIVSVINEYGENQQVLQEISAKLDSFSWIGSAVPHYENRILILKGFINHEKECVSTWAKKQITFYEYKIEKAKDDDEESVWR